MGCGSSKTTPFSPLPPPISISELINNSIEHVMDQPTFVHLIGVASTTTHQHIKPPFYGNELANAGLLHKITAKKQSRSQTNKSKLLKLYEYYGAVPFTLADENNPAHHVVVRLTKHCQQLRLKFAAKICNLEYDPANPDDLFGGGKPNMRRDMISHAGSGKWWESTVGSFDPIVTIQSKEGKYGFGFQRTVWIRTLKKGDRCAIKGQVVTPSEEEKEMHGDNVVVVLLGADCALTNVENEIEEAAESGACAAGVHGLPAANEEDEKEQYIDMIRSTVPMEWVKTNAKDVKHREDLVPSAW
jgi:hypothetical protein